MERKIEDKYEIYACNFLKGIMWNCIENDKFDLAIKFLEDHKDLMTFFEKSGVLNYSIKANEHTKNIVIPFLELGYNLNEDKYSIFTALESKHFKTTKILLQNGFDPNSAISGSTIVDKCFKLITIKSSNTTIKKSLDILNSFPYRNLSNETFMGIENNIEEASRTLSLINKQPHSFCGDYIEVLDSIKDNYTLEKDYRNLQEKLVTNKVDNIKRNKI